VGEGERLNAFGVSRRKKEKAESVESGTREGDIHEKWGCRKGNGDRGKRMLSRVLRGVDMRSVHRSEGIACIVNSGYLE